MNKAMEDNSIYPDGTVRNSLDDVVSFRWGGDGLHPAKLERAPLGLLRESKADVRARMTAEEATVALECRATVLRTKTHVLCTDAKPDARVLLPFHPGRVRAEVERARAAGLSGASVRGVPRNSL